VYGERVAWQRFACRKCVRTHLISPPLRRKVRQYAIWEHRMSRTQHIEVPAVARGKHDKDGRQVCLIEAATAVFAEKGYDAATTREVAERAGVSEGLIHRYFGGKHGLLIAILDAKAESVLASRSDELPLRPSLLEELEQLLVWTQEQYWDKRALMRVTVSRAAIDPEIGRRVGDRLNQAHVTFIAERLRVHQAGGRVRGDADIDAIAMAISGLNISFGFFGQVAFEIDRGELRRQSQAIARVLARGLAPDASGLGGGMPASQGN
jgi:AcrR family transcriptional regulator